MDSLTSKNECTIVEFREFIHQFVADFCHRCCIVGPPGCVFNRRSCKLNLRIERLRIEGFFEEQLRQTNTVSKNRRNDEGCKEYSSNNGHTALFPTPSALTSKSQSARQFHQGVLISSNSGTILAEVAVLQIGDIATHSSSPSSSRPQAERMSEASVFPSLRRSIRSALDAKSGSCVTMRIEIGLSSS